MVLLYKIGETGVRGNIEVLNWNGSNTLGPTRGRRETTPPKTPGLGVGECRPAKDSSPTGFALGELVYSAVRVKMRPVNLGPHPILGLVSSPETGHFGGRSPTLDSKKRKV